MTGSDWKWLLDRREYVVGPNLYYTGVEPKIFYTGVEPKVVYNGHEPKIASAPNLINCLLD